MAESRIWIYKTELIGPEGPWRNVDHIEMKTLRWVHWCTQCTHESIDDYTPVGVVQAHHAIRNRLAPTW